MPRPPIDLDRKIREVPRQSTPLPPLADRPIQHFEAVTNDGLSLIRYLGGRIDPEDVYQAVYEKHFGHLRRMVLAELIESFEGLLKELAAVCVDFLAPYVTDDRYGPFLPKRSDTIAAFVNASSLGKALCESDTWLNNATISARFAALLRTPNGDDWERLFPQTNQPPSAERARAATLAVLWQIRHNLAHNVGVVTLSDAMKFRVLVGGPVAADARLTPRTEDLRYVKRFLSETADRTNRRIGERLAQLLGDLHAVDSGLFDAQEKADAVSRRFAIPLTIDGRTGNL